MKRKLTIKIGKDPIPVQRILDEARLIMNLFLDLPNNPKPERQGGYITIVDRETGQILFVCKIGEIEDDAARDYFSFSQEKAGRLMLWPQHVSSWQSRDEKNKQWGGAIKTFEFILSFSGLPELGDEAVMLLLAYSFNWINFDEMMNIAKISENPFVDALNNQLWK